MMPHYIALLRGINVGKAKRIAMADLREVFAELGFTSVKTLLQSGNVVFHSSIAPDAAEIEAAVLARTGVRSTTLVLSETDFRRVAAADPLLEAADNPSRHMLVFLDRQIAPVELPDPDVLGDELISQGERAFYQWFAHGVLDTRVPTSFWKHVGETGVITTSRNRRTVDKLLAILDTQPPE